MYFHYKYVISLIIFRLPTILASNNINSNLFSHFLVEEEVEQASLEYISCREILGMQAGDQNGAFITLVNSLDDKSFLQQFIDNPACLWLTKYIEGKHQDILKRLYNIFMKPDLKDFFLASNLLKNLNEEQLEMIFQRQDALFSLAHDVNLGDYYPAQLPLSLLVHLGHLLKWDFGVHQRDVCLRIFSTENKLKDMLEVHESLFVFAACLPSTLTDTGDHQDVETYLQNLLSLDRYHGMEKLTARCKTNPLGKSYLFEYDYEFITEVERADIESWIPSLRLLVPILMASFVNNGYNYKAALKFLDKIRDFLMYVPYLQQLAHTYPKVLINSQGAYEFEVSLDFILGPEWKSHTVDKLEQKAKSQHETQDVDEKKTTVKHSSTKKHKNPPNDDLEVTQGSSKHVKKKFSKIGQKYSFLSPMWETLLENASFMGKMTIRADLEVTQGSPKHVKKKFSKIGQKYSFLSPMWETLLENASFMEKMTIRAVVESGSRITEMPEDQQIPLSSLARYFLHEEVDVGGLIGLAALKKFLRLAGLESNLALVIECLNYSNPKHDFLGHLTEAEVREALMPDLKSGSTINIYKSKILHLAFNETMVAYQKSGIPKISIPFHYLLSFFKLVLPQFDDEDASVRVHIVDERDLEESHRTPLSKHALDENGQTKVAPPTLTLRLIQDGWVATPLSIYDQLLAQELTRQIPAWPTNFDEKDQTSVETKNEMKETNEAFLELKEDIKQSTGSNSSLRELKSTPIISSTEVLERKSVEERKLERQKRIQQLHERQQGNFCKSDHDWSDFKKWDKVYKDFLHTSLDTYDKNIKKKSFKSGNFKVVFFKADLEERKVQDEGGLTTEWITSFWRLLMQPALGLTVASLDDNQSIGLNLVVSVYHAQLLGWLFGVALRKNIGLDPLPLDFLKLFVERGAEDLELEDVFEGDSISQYLAKYSPFYRLMFHSHRAWHKAKEEKTAAGSRAIVDQMKENFPVDMTKLETLSLALPQFNFKKPASDSHYDLVKFDKNFAQFQKLDSDFATQMKPAKYGTREMADFALLMMNQMKTSLRQVKIFFVQSLSLNIACNIKTPPTQSTTNRISVTVPREPFWTILLQTLLTKTSILSVNFFMRNLRVKTPVFKCIDEHGTLFADPKDAWRKVFEILAFLDEDRLAGIAQIRRIHEVFGIKMQKSNFLDKKRSLKPLQFTPYKVVYDGSIAMNKLAINKDAFVFTTNPEVLYHFKSPNALEKENLHTKPLTNSSSSNSLPDTSSKLPSAPKVEKKEREVKHKLGERQESIDNNLTVKPANSYMHGLLHAFTSSKNAPLSEPTLLVEAMEKEEIERSGLMSFHTCFNKCNINCNHLWSLSELIEHLIGHIISSEYTVA